MKSRTYAGLVDVTVITPTMPGREQMLAEARASIDHQTMLPVAHLIELDTPEVPNPGSLARARNRLLARVTTDWVACLDDDDRYLPHHMATIAPHLAGDADVIYTWPTRPVVILTDVTGWAPSLVAAELRRTNLVPSNACIRRSVVEKLGGWSEDYDMIGRRFPSGCTWEDWDLWLRMAEAGSSFHCVPAQTWEYRTHDAQSSRTWGE